MAMAHVCSIAGCGKPVKSRGYCVAHYKRFMRHGDPLAGRTPNGEAAKFLQFALSYEGDDCLIWPFARCEKGYARINFPGRSNVVSHVVCEETQGPAPSCEHQAAHQCGNGGAGCVTKGHLVWKTPTDNEADKIKHGTHNRGERHPMAKLTEDSVREIFWDDRSYDLIASAHGISIATVSQIKDRSSWVWLDMGKAA